MEIVLWLALPAIVLAFVLIKSIDERTHEAVRREEMRNRWRLAKMMPASADPPSSRWKRPS